MTLASITQSLKSRFEGYIPQLSSTEAIVLTGATLAYQLYQKSLVGTLLTGAAFAATACLRLRERVTFANVIDRLEQLDGDLKTSIKKGNFAAKKTLFINRYNAIQKVFASNQNHYSATQWQKSLKQLHGVSQRIQREVNPIQKVFFVNVLAESISLFLGGEEVARTAPVSRFWNQSINTPSHWKQQYAKLISRSIKAENPSEAAIPASVNYRQLFRDFYPKTFGREFYQNYLRYGVDVGPVPPIPPQLLEKADAVIFVPEYFTMTLPESSPLGLDQNGKLTENPDEYHNRPPAVDGKRVLQVPVTLNNLDILTRRHLKKGAPTGIDHGSWQNVLQQHGNAHFPSHWSGQKRALMGKELPFAQQQAAAQQARLEVVPLLDRFLFNLLTHVRSGTFVDNPDNVARTATVVLDNNNNPWQASVCPFDPSSGLRLNYYDFDFDNVGVAVGVPSGSSQAIGT